MAQTVNVAVASNFIAPMKVLVTGFEQTSGQRLKISMGSSGKFFAQISQGAPFDLFFSADTQKPAKLVESGLAKADSRFTYALGKLVLWSSNIKFSGAGYEVLKTDDFNKLALANPRLAPYGQAAIEVLEQLDLAGITRSRWVQGENIAQTFQFVGSGNADLGFVALSQIVNSAELSNKVVWAIPNDFYAPIRQDAVLLERSQNNKVAKAFLDYVQSDKGRLVIESFGYTSNHPEGN